MDEGNQGHREAIGEESGRVGDVLTVLTTAANSYIDGLTNVCAHALREVGDALAVLATAANSYIDGSD